MIKELSLALLLCFGAARAQALSDPGITAAPILQVPVSARAVGMGNAFTGVADDVTALQYNPAGMSLLKSQEANFQYIKGLVDQNIEYLAFGSPLPFRGFLGSGYSTLAGSIVYGQEGSIQVNTTNPDGSLAGSQTLSAGSDLVATIGYAERIWDSSFEFQQNTFHVEHFLGVSGKIVHSTLVQQYSATAYAVDMGYFARSLEQGWSVGASVLNLGTKMTFISEGDPLPLAFRLGGAYRVSQLPKDHALTVALDGNYDVYSHVTHINAGIEYGFMSLLKARLGYQFEQDLAGLTAGFGFDIDNFTIDYAWALNSAINDMHRIGLTYHFGQVKKEEREQPRRQKIESFPEPSNIKDLEQKTPQNYEPPKKINPNPEPAPSQQDQGPVWIY